MNLVLPEPLHSAVIIYLPWLLSVVTLTQSWMAGNNHPRAWALGIINQFLWLAWITYSGNTGFILLNLGLWIIYWRNHRKWKVK